MSPTCVYYVRALLTVGFLYRSVLWNASVRTEQGQCRVHCAGISALTGACRCRLGEFQLPPGHSLSLPFGAAQTHFVFGIAGVIDPVLNGCVIVDHVKPALGHK